MSQSDSCDIVISADGCAQMIYSELVDAFALGEQVIQRASHVEPDIDGYWFADLAPVGGPRLGPCLHRSAALALESEWLRFNWLENEKD